MPGQIGANHNQHERKDEKVDKTPQPNPDVSRETQPQQTGNRQTDNETAAAQARQTFKTPHDMTYATPNSTLVGKEHMTPNGTPILETPNGKYRGTLNENGNIAQWQPIDNNGKDIGKPIQVTSERTGAPPDGTRPEQYVVAPKVESVKAPEPSRKEQQKSEAEPVSAEPKNPFEAQKQLYETKKQNFEAQKHYFEQAVQSLSNPTIPEKPEAKTTKIEHISVAPAPELQRTSDPFSIFAQRLDRTITSSPNTVEYGREFVNNRDSRQLFKPSLESFQKPAETFKPQGLQIKPEPLSDLRIRQDLRTNFVSPLQGLSEPFTFKPLKPINRADIIEQLGDIGKSKIPSIAAMLAILLAGRKADIKETPSKATENSPRLEPKLEAMLGKVQQPQKDKLVEIATKVKEGKADNLPAADENISKRIKQVEPRQLDSLIAWAQGKSPIKFDVLPPDFQTNLSSILEHVIKATAVRETKEPAKAAEPSVKPTDKTVISDKTVPADKTIIDKKPEKTEIADKTKPVETPLKEDKTIQIKGEAIVDEEKTVVTYEDSESEDDGDDTKPSVELVSTLQADSPKKPNRKTKPFQERDAIDDRKPPVSTLLNDTTRRIESGSLDSQYQIILQTLVKGEWKNVLECAVKDDEALYIQHYSHKAPFKHSMNGLPKITQIIQNNFFKNWLARIKDYFGDT